jgi:hypothetical protein
MQVESSTKVFRVRLINRLVREKDVWFPLKSYKICPGAKRYKVYSHFCKLGLVFSHVEILQQKSTTITKLLRSERTREMEDGMAEVWLFTDANVELPEA